MKIKILDLRCLTCPYYNEAFQTYGITVCYRNSFAFVGTGAKEEKPTDWEETYLLLEDYMED